MDPKLEFLLSYTATLRPGVDVGPGPFGVRRIFDVTGGRFEGPRLRGRLQASGADWILIGPDGVGRLDVRATLETDDGAFLYLSYHGFLEFNERVGGALAKGGSTEYGDSYFMSSPRFETGDPRYAWLNALVTVGQGRVLPGAVEYRVFAVKNG